MKLWFVLGTAAELIKVYPLIREADSRSMDWTVVSTGQSAVNFWIQYDDFALPRHRAITALHTDSDLSSGSSALTWLVRAWRTSVSSWFTPSQSGHDYFIVHGDTFSTLVGARWGKRAGAEVVHVEAGLRSSHLLSPFPEELNRRFVSRMTKFHMAPDEWAVANLRAAGYSEGVIDTGANTLADAVRMLVSDDPRATATSATASSSDERPFVIANIHRFENLNSARKWSFIVDTLVKAARDYEVRAVMHPQTKAKIDADPKAKQRMTDAGIRFFDRLPFATFIRQLARAEYVISDGGSNQEECHYLGKPCLILRDATERREGLDGSCLLTKFDPNSVARFLESPKSFARPVAWPTASPSKKIMDVLIAADRKHASKENERYTSPELAE